MKGTSPWLICFAVVGVIAIIRSLHLSSLYLGFVVVAAVVVLLIASYLSNPEKEEDNDA